MIPEQAIRIRDLIRKHVPRPVEAPKATNARACSFRFEEGCPMGLLPHSVVGCPVTGSDFDTSTSDLPPLYDEEVAWFALWWDRQTDAKAAMDEVWGA